jgi:hypothetical protein
VSPRGSKQRIGLTLLVGTLKGQGHEAEFKYCYKNGKFWM